ncbi:MAG TPA: AAA family ATPase [archaeon]|jgi:dephospho-CoA kinase|nr:AAA family ATPase [archaeon]
MSEKMIVFINGPTAVGKTTVSRILKEQHGATMVSISTILREEGKKVGAKTAADFVEKNLKGSIEKKLACIINNLKPIVAKNNLICIESAYNQIEIDAIKKYFGKKGSVEFKAVYLTADLNKRINRLMRRENIKDRRCALIRTLLVNAIRSKMGMTNIKYDIVHKNNSKKAPKKLVKKIIKPTRRRL